MKARGRTLQIASEREDAWQRAAAERVNAARGALTSLVDELERRFDEYREAAIEDVLAREPRAREARATKIAAGAPKLPESLDAWLQLGRPRPSV